MFLIYFISLKLIKTIQKCLIVWDLLGALINNVLIKNSKFILFSFFFPWYFSKPSKNVCYFRIYEAVIINKSAYKNWINRS